MLVQSIKTDYDSLTEQFLTEFIRFKIQKSIDIRDSVLKFATLEAEHDKKVETMWASILPILQSAEINTSTEQLAKLNIASPAKPTKIVKNADV